MSQRELAVFRDGCYNDPTLQEWIPDLVQRLVERFDPLKMILFGSLATGEGGPDSDIDLVVVPKVDDKHRLAVDMRLALADMPVSNDVIPTDPDEVRRRGESLGGSCEGLCVRVRSSMSGRDLRDPAGRDEGGASPQSPRDGMNPTSIPAARMKRTRLS